MDQARLVSAIAGLARAATGDFAVTQMLRALCEAAAQALRVDGAAVVLHQDGHNTFVHAVGPHVSCRV
jgi:hypothetical protein